MTIYLTASLILKKKRLRRNRNEPKHREISKDLYRVKSMLLVMR